MAEKTPEEMREAVLAIREKMAAAAREAGRDPAEVQLCAACKTRTAETVAQLETAQLLQISRSYVSRLETHALNQLRKGWLQESPGE